MKKEVTEKQISKPEEENMEKEVTKKRKNKRISKPEEEKRIKILSGTINKWVYTRNNYSNEFPKTFIKHMITPEHKYSKLFQIILTGDPIQDGLYVISDYEVGYVYCNLKKKTQIELKIKKYDLKIGMFSENHFFETYEEMIDCLIKEKYITKEEFNQISKNKSFHKNKEEISMPFALNNRRGKRN